MQEFRDYDKKTSLKQAALSVLSSILSLSAVARPSELLNFILLTFADLKSYRFTYWLGVPAIIPESTVFTSSPIRLLKEQLDDNGCNVCIELYRALLKKLLTIQEDGESESALQTVFALRFPIGSEDLHQSETAGDPTEYQMQHIHHAELLSFADAWESRHAAGVYIVVADPSASANGFGWVVRNLLAMLALHHPGGSCGTEGPLQCRVIGLRGQAAKKLFT